MIMTKFAGISTIASAVVTVAAVAESHLMAAIVALFGTIISGVTWYALKAVPEQARRMEEIANKHHEAMLAQSVAAKESARALIQELKEGREATAAERRAELEYWRQHNGKAGSQANTTETPSG